MTTDRIDDTMSLRSLLRADLERARVLACGDSQLPTRGLRFWVGSLSPRFAPILLYRVSNTLHRKGFRRAAKVFALINLLLFGIEIATRCPIGPGLYLPHTHGTVIGAWRIGANATIFQGVTLGARHLDFEYSEAHRPILDDDVTLGAGAKVLGKVRVGSRAVVGANAVVLTDVPAGMLAVGVPSSLVSKSA